MKKEENNNLDIILKKKNSFLAYNWCCWFYWLKYLREIATLKSKGSWR